MSLSDQPLKEPTIAETWSTLQRLIDRLDPIARFIELELEQSSESIAQLRGKANNALWIGKIQIPAAGSWDADYQVPFARVGYVDFSGAGAFHFSTGSGRDEMGAGTYESFAGGGDAGMFPFIGRHLSIWPDSGDACQLFVVVLTSQGDLAVSS